MVAIAWIDYTSWPDSESPIFTKFKDGLQMASTKLTDAGLKELADFAAGWGKLLAQEAVATKPGLDMTLADMEEIAAVATQAIVREAVGAMAEAQAQTLAPQQPCPTCGKLCDVDRKSRTVAVRGGTAELHEPVARCSTCRRDFFPSAPGVAD